MIGVVLWSDTDCGKAVFWCEDQGDLAYYDHGRMHGPHGGTFFDAGDMVQFDVSIEDRLRIAHNTKLVQEQAWSGLPERLREREPADDVGEGQKAFGKVVPFESNLKAKIAKRVVALLA